MLTADFCYITISRNQDKQRIVWTLIIGHQYILRFGIAFKGMLTAC